MSLENLTLESLTAETSAATSKFQEAGMTNAVTLLNLCMLEGVTAFVGQDTGDIYTRYPNADGRFEIIGLESKKFKSWLTAKFLMARGVECYESDIKSCLRLLEALAWQSDPIKIYTRWAHVENDIFLDLNDSERHVIHISAAGSEVIADAECPIWFHRPHGMKALPTPERGDGWAMLRRFMNVSDDDFSLVLCWLITAPLDVPHFILVLNSVHGSGKSTLTKLINDCVDPRAESLLSPPKDTDALIASGAARCLLAFDNASTISGTLSDALCRISNGGGFEKRELYTNNEAFSVSLRKPIILNGIGLSPERGDLIDRSFFVETSAIPPERRLSESELFENFSQSMPVILHSLCHALHVGLRTNAYTPTQLGRRADAEKFIRRSAHGGGLPFSEPQIVETLRTAERERGLDALAADTFSQKILALGKLQREWRGTAQELTELILKGESLSEQRVLPNTARKTANNLKRIEPLLANVGVVIERERTTNDRVIVLKFQ